MPSIRSASAILVFLLVAAACGGGDVRPGVEVRSLNTDLGLGIEEEGPANILIDRPIARPDLDRKPPPKFELPAFKPLQQLEFADLGSCPKASRFEGADVAPVEVEGRPKEGSYRWWIEGEAQTDDGLVKFEGFRPRAVFDVKDDAFVDNAYQFKEFQTIDFDHRTENFAVQITTYYVISDSGVDSPPNPAGAIPNNADPGEGLYIRQIQTIFFGDGETVELSFDPNPMIQLLRFPVEINHSVDSTGVDAQDGARLNVKGRVAGKVPVDACGDKIDTWFVEGSRIFSASWDHDEDPGTPNKTTEYTAQHNYYVATQRGGHIVAEDIEAPLRDEVQGIEPILKAKFKIGQYEPNPDEGEDP